MKLGGIDSHPLAALLRLWRSPAPAHLVAGVGLQQILVPRHDVHAQRDRGQGHVAVESPRRHHHVQSQRAVDVEVAEHGEVGQPPAGRNKRISVGAAGKAHPGWPGGWPEERIGARQKCQLVALLRQRQPGHNRSTADDAPHQWDRAVGEPIRLPHVGRIIRCRPADVQSPGRRIVMRRPCKASGRVCAAETWNAC